MDGAIARSGDGAGRLALAALLALGLHALVLLAPPAGWWSLRFPKPPRFDVLLLPPVTRPIPAPSVLGSESTRPVPAAPDSPARASVSMPATAPPSALTPAVALATPAPASTPPPLAPPVQTQAAKPPLAQPTAPGPARKPVPKAAVPDRPSVAAKTVPKPRTNDAAPTSRPQLRPMPKPAPNLPDKPLGPPRTTPAPSTQPPPPSVKSPAPVVASEPSDPARHPERPQRSGSEAGPSRRSRLDSSALLGQIASLETAAQRRENATARGKRVNPRDTQSLEGFYIAAWVRKVEQIGEMNFPDIARKLDLNTGPVLDVTIRADGSLQEVRVVRSSGNAELDRAAQRIVKLGAPYAPFSAQLRQHFDVLSIARPWRFEPAGRLRAR
ncbi:MAG: TonB family protein [Candidatus Competibacteraceae bacterium]|jgi:protein TonB|nr:TonB family protein [Candidatus Competibacteraceae bacterium]MBK8964927.1 TonB family protein [Candidatus Competibacteraceae bacterium]